MASTTLRGNPERAVPETLTVNGGLTLVLFDLRATREYGRLLLAENGLALLRDAHRRVLSRDPDLGRHQMRVQEITELKRRDGDRASIEAIRQKENALQNEFKDIWFYKLAGKEWFIDDGAISTPGFHNVAQVADILNQKSFGWYTVYKPDDYKATVVVGTPVAEGAPR